MSRQVICIKELKLNKYDEDGYATTKYFTIPKGMIFNWNENDTHRYIDGEVHLENDKYWIELLMNEFKECFKEIKEIE